MPAAHDADMFRKSSYSSTNTSCVEVSLSRSVRVRDTKDRDGGTVEVPFTTWRAFTASLSEL